MELIESHLCFGGEQRRYKHSSKVLGCEMTVAVFLPPDFGPHTPVLYWLSGLTCTDENFVQKAGAQRLAAELGLAIVAPDTSPRGDAVADDAGYDLGKGAGFYVNATQAPWAEHYRMDDYVVRELPPLVEALGLGQRRGVSGHSMGGHGALVLALRNRDHFASVSAFSPICNPMDCPWGQKAFTAYLGEDKAGWAAYDASVLLAEAKAPWPIRVDVGLADNFLAEQLKVESLEQAARQSGSVLQLHRQAGYDHSYFFVASFMEAHLRFHAAQLK
ncbi:S-formylglutathione hydrolase [Gallaecimonas xiamenensis]|uniref:S-formylglutathione hydrolase n=1 Tax=Gallaecimonas xiamenensis 3-C-1 TaxID=745411 RepID=K2JZF3_9GAMM|nr:S-formylglutathione hydrolase [Gallaecimonas xiamenensis]EKE75684.1 S-formylglutathione hydrolase [Gallaecimonas xiamenensis 3-C-1]